MGSRDRALRLLDYVFVLRPATLVPLWLFYLNGSTLAASRLSIRLPLFYPARDVALGFVAMTSILGAAFLLNQIADVESDRINEKLYFLPRGIISIRAALLEATLLVILGVGCSVPLSTPFRWLLAASLVLGVTYSVPPVRAKARTPHDLVWNALGFGLVATLAGWSSVGALSREPLWIGLGYSLAVGGVVASTTILDRDGDEASGLRTTGVALGEQRTSVLAIALLVAAAGVGVVVRDPVAALGPILSLPMMVWSHRSGERSNRILANQISVALFSVLVGIRFPFFLVLFALVYLSSRAYYRARFGVSYPGPGTR
jgi:4-hydroxybenzoate polyprenyltransferase